MSKKTLNLSQALNKNTKSFTNHNITTSDPWEKIIKQSNAKMLTTSDTISLPLTKFLYLIELKDLHLLTAIEDKTINIDSSTITDLITIPDRIPEMITPQIQKTHATELTLAALSFGFASALITLIFHPNIMNYLIPTITIALSISLLTLIIFLAISSNWIKNEKLKFFLQNF